MVWTRFQTWFLVCSCLSDTVCSGKSQSPRALTDFPPKRVNKLQNVSQKVLFPSNVQQYPPGGRNKELWLTTRYSGLFFSRHPTYSGSQVWCLHAGQDSKGFVFFFPPRLFFDSSVVAVVSLFILSLWPLRICTSQGWKHSEGRNTHWAMCVWIFWYVLLFNPVVFNMFHFSAVESEWTAVHGRMYKM